MVSRRAVAERRWARRMQLRLTGSVSGCRATNSRKAHRYMYGQKLGCSHGLAKSASSRPSSTLGAVYIISKSSEIIVRGALLSRRVAAYLYRRYSPNPRSLLRPNHLQFHPKEDTESQKARESRADWRDGL